MPVAVRSSGSNSAPGNHPRDRRLSAGWRPTLRWLLQLEVGRPPPIMMDKRRMQASFFGPGPALRRVCIECKLELED